MSSSSFGSSFSTPQSPETPLMKQYWSIKSRYQDQILLFRMGDFYEMFHQDAELAAPILNITLTSRNKKQNNSTPMCGFPHHSLQGPVAKLLNSGYKVAICDQMEEASAGKKIVRRDVTQVLTPGMVYDPETLDELSACYISAYDDRCVCFWDTSTSEAFYYEYETKDDRKSLLSLLSPVELILTEAQKKENEFQTHLTVFETTQTLEDLSAQKPTQNVEAVNRLLAYVEDLVKKPQTQKFDKKGLKLTMRLSEEAFTHLEIFKNSKHQTQGSLFSVLNFTETPMGARTLKRWLQFPLSHKESLEERFLAVENWIQDQNKLISFKKALKLVGDLERKLHKISKLHATPRDLANLGEALKQAHKAYKILDSNFEPLSIGLEIEKTLKNLEDLPISLKEGGFIRKGVCETLDELIELSSKTQKKLHEFELREKELTGISSLKVKYNNVFGYSLEVTKTHKDKVPSRYQRKQTLVQAERYITDELVDLEEKILSSHKKKVDLEKKIFFELKEKIQSSVDDILSWSQDLSQKDVLSNFAWLSLERSYVKPCLGGNLLEISHSRHPVLELQTSFVPNTIKLAPKESFLITGPNMAGKSTLMRQVALSVLMSQIGCFVPASKAQLPIYKKLFTRIGAHDFLSGGLSTFMVEMTETAEILKKADSESLVVIDEIGRGTSTYDGMSLAFSILQYLTKLNCHVFFATHYHELSRIELEFPQVKNVHMGIDEKKGKLSFLYLLKKGVADKSYGIQVAELAGLPWEVTEQSKKILLSLERNSNGKKELTKESAENEVLEAQNSCNKLLEEVKNLDLNLISPLEVVRFLENWQKEEERS